MSIGVCLLGVSIGCVYRVCLSGVSIAEWDGHAEDKVKIEGQS